MEPIEKSQEQPIILVVEDNPVERQLVGKILRNANFEVIAVDCGEVVLETVIDYQPDLILLDALLPDIDGFDVCEHLRAHPKGAYIPVIMLTGLDDVSSINRAYEVGATDFFTKPINHSLLVHRIRYLLRARLIMDQLRMSQQSLASAQQVAKLGHWELDVDRNRFKISEEMFRLYRLQGEYDEHDTSVLMERCHPDDRQYLFETLTTAIRELKETRVEHRIVFDDGTECYLEVHITVMRDEGAGTTHLLGISIDVTERKESEREILSLAYCDRLTGLSNRSLLEKFLEQVIPRAHMSGRGTALLSLDLDLFNRVNNSMGHSAGDSVLQKVSERLRELIHCADASQLLERLSLSTEASLDDFSKDMVARLAADTFIVVLGSVDRRSGDVERLAARIKDSFQQPFIYRGQELFVTGSIGIAYSESGGSTAEGLLQKADLALHEAKMQGRNEVREYSGDLVAKVSTHLSIQSDLRKALQNGEFQLFYQPKISTKDASVKGFEALIRWIHPVKGLIPPDQFITVAEETGQIVDIGQWVLETACVQNKRWLEMGLVDVRVAVNVAARQFKEGNLLEVVEGALARSGLSERNLELEITEGVLMSDPNTENVIAELRGRGVSIALDDFGTGYSSLSYITRFPIDTIKIDRCFVQDITINSDKAAIVSAVSNLSHGLNFNVVAEGVETEVELEVIRQLKCDEVQGYYYCRPMAADDISDWLRARDSSSLSSAG
ncbi:bifunctional diguanylate cyclase/phosphodiesterase [Oceanicoccus sp. KOV_DT_Chl]|uniref:putative bifunctional diguanylate cyclase/phosphodiesterase n=1 Tax=Oceanicoccus sp. KOV_DT_Chl TaxID=1904639 RepID=UPI000C7AAEA9|nr:EAL domain-containing protein [Oceanicoccus sp. KOV_DT_Chl]